MNKAASALDSTFKYALVLLGCIAVRFVPRPPNVEPIMSGALPFAKKLGPASGGVFAALGILVFDAAAGQVGVWSLFGAVTYGIIGTAAGIWFAGGNNAGRRGYVCFAVVATVFYDAVTALAFGYYFGYSLPVLVAGQVPFTLLHLTSNVLGAAIVCPLLEKYIVENESLSFSRVLSGLRGISYRL